MNRETCNLFCAEKCVEKSSNSQRLQPQACVPGFSLFSFKLMAALHLLGVFRGVLDLTESACHIETCVHLGRVLRSGDPGLPSVSLASTPSVMRPDARGAERVRSWAQGAPRPLASFFLLGARGRGPVFLPLGKAASSQRSAHAGKC